MYSTYVIKSAKTNKYYIGYTNNIDSRLTHHNSGANKSTKLGVPWEIIYTENFPTKREAWLREHQIKSYKGGEAFKKLIGGVA